MTTESDRSASCSPAGWRAAWAAATRRASGSAARPSSSACSRGSAPQCAAIILNANGDPARFADTGLPVVPDSVPDFAGPLAGILAGLDWAAAHAPDIADVVSVPGDCPFLPGDLVARLAAARAARPARRSPARARATGAIRWSGCGRSALRDDLRRALVEEDLHKIEIWTARHGVAIADWPASRSIRSSTSTRPRMSPRPSALRRSTATI